jgi:hypothetical protein
MTVSRISMTTFVIRLLQYKLVRFFIVAGINSLFGYGIFSFLVWTGSYRCSDCRDNNSYFF